MRSRIVFVLALVSAFAVTPARAAAPSNDGFGDAKRIRSLPFRHTVSTKNATVQRNEQMPSCGRVEATVWYEFTAGQTTSVVAGSLDSNHDTFLALYTGSSLTKLVEQVCNDDAGTERGSMIGWTAEPGVTYYIQAGPAPNAGGGRLELHVGQGFAQVREQYHAIGPYHVANAGLIADPDDAEPAARIEAGICILNTCEPFAALHAQGHASQEGAEARVCHKRFLEPRECRDL